MNGKLRCIRDQVLQRVILLIIFGKIGGQRLWGDSLQRVVAKAAALMGGGDNAAFLANDLFLAELAAKLAVSAPAVDLFSKQHVKTSLLAPIIHYEYAVFQRKFLEPARLPTPAVRRSLEPAGEEPGKKTRTRDHTGAQPDRPKPY